MYVLRATDGVWSQARRDLFLEGGGSTSCMRRKGERKPAINYPTVQSIFGNRNRCTKRTVFDAPPTWAKEEGVRVVLDTKQRVKPDVNRNNNT